MISYNDFPVIPQNGIICKEEGSILRIYFDIKPHVAPESENEPEEMRIVDSGDQYVCENVDVKGRTYSDIVSAIVNDHYSSDDVQALQANYIEAKESDSELDNAKREEYLLEYSEFQAWRKKAKEVAIIVLTLI